MKQKSAVEWLVEKTFSDFGKSVKSQEIKMAMQMEKKQIMEAVIFGDCRGRITTYLTDEQYYNENYGSKGSDEIEKSEKPINLTSSQTEISDEEIINGAIEHCEKKHEWWSLEVNAMVAGAKWYREQLKQRQ